MQPLQDCRSLAVTCLSLAFALSLAACQDPAKDQARATSAAPVASASAPAAAGTLYTITPQTSKLEWTGSKVTGTHAGSFAAFSGTISVVGGSVEKSRVTVDIDTTSLTSSPDKLVTHLKSPDFFGVEQFPRATFASTSLKAAGDKASSYQVTGNLSFHGVSRSISFPANITIAGDVVNADASFSINRKDFNLNYPGKVDDLIRDDVLITFSLHAAKTG